MKTLKDIRLSLEELRAQKEIEITEWAYSHDFSDQKYDELCEELRQINYLINCVAVCP